MAGLLLPPIGVLVFMHGAETNLRMFFLARTEGAFNAGPLIGLAGAVIVGVGIVAARWSPWGILIAGAASVVMGVLQFIFPFTIDAGMFAVARSLSRIPGLFGVNDIEQGLLAFLLGGGALPFGAVLIGAGLALRAAAKGSVVVLWIAVAGAVLGAVALIIGQGMLVQSMRMLVVDAAHVPILVIGSLALGAAAYAGRSSPFALLAVAVPVAALGLLGVALPDLWSSSSAPLPLSMSQSYVITQGYVLLYGVMLAATSVAGLVRKQAVDAAHTAAV